MDPDKTPIKVEFLNDLLKNNKNLNDAKLFLNGFKFEFRLQYKGPRISRISKQLLSAETNPFGCSLPCALFEKFATMLHWAVTSYTGINTLYHYLDDFIFIGPSSSDHCYILMNTFLDISNQLGVPINDSKTVWPTTLLTFSGLDIDTVAMTIKIPEEKLLKLKKYSYSPFINEKGNTEGP